MKLKRLEIQGFKSFKDKTVIHFDHGITGIVGPNGCGKSNIVDAFFWVMGEQSYKQMRGSGTEDLIFNGSSKYAPLAIAEATLIMEIEELPSAESIEASAGALSPKTREISVTRRVYRDGQGEYLINGQTSRLKDIHELFLDTGAGSKGYSIIEQGQIGKIVNSKPEDRRILIEEAAGIAKYKARKKETLRKIDSTNTNLGRLNDVIQEIERNLSSLDRQAQKARLYKKYKEELSEKELYWGRRKAKVIQERLATAEKRKFEKEAKVTEERATLQIIENQLESDRLEQLNDSKSADDLQLIVDRLSETILKAQSEEELSKQRIRFLMDQKTTLERETLEIQSQFQVFDQTIAELLNEVTTLDQDLVAVQAQLATLQAELQDQTAVNQKTEAALNQGRNDYYQCLQRETQLATQIATAKSRIENQTQLCARITSQRETLEEKILALDADISKSNEIIENRSIQLETEKRSLEEHLAQILTLEAEFQDNQGAKLLALQSLTEVKSRLKTLSDLERNFEGYGDGAKHILQSVHGIDDLRDGVFAFAPLIQSEARYQTALEAWLDFQTDEIVLSDVAQFQNIRPFIEELKTQNLGRVTFRTALEGMKSDSPAEKGPSEIHGHPEKVSEELSASGVHCIGSLQSLITDRFVETLGEAKSTLLRRLLGFSDVYVIESFPLSLDQLLPFVSRHHIAVVSLDGQVLKPNGEIRGGSIRPTTDSGVLGRSLVLENLKQDVLGAEALVSTHEARAQELQNTLLKKREESEVVKRGCQVLELELHSQQAQLRQFESIRNNLKSELTSGEQEYHRIVAEQRELETSLEELANQEIIQKQTKAESEGLIQALEAEVTNNVAAINEKSKAHQTLQLRLTSLTEQLRSAERTLNTKKSQRQEKELRLLEITQQIETAKNEIQNLENQIAPLHQQILESTTQLSEKRELLAAVRDRLEKSATQLNEVLERIRNGHANIDLESRELNDIAILLERLTGELNHLRENLEEKYGQGCLEDPAALPIQEEMTDPVVTEAISAEEEQLLGEEVEKLRERIRRLGEVNLMAIEEFEETKKRHDHLLRERSDLNTSLDHLNEAILHINQISESRFKLAFETIANRFHRLFPIIFGGGYAELSLSYPEGSTDILDAGVEILAQPPGKKIANITLLSGGEKALTAICMIFAIFMVKPSPFCILDEVDAPLDDTNIGKFNALLREMSGSSQFVVITHNKKTMELNDVLYGVTMEEPGVSKMVSIELH